MNKYSITEFDEIKTKVLKYVLYKKRTEAEVRRKFSNIEDILLDDVINYLKEEKYIDDMNYIKRAVNEFVNINTLSIKEIKYKLQSKGLDYDLIEQYIDNNMEKLLEYERKSAKKIYAKKINNFNNNDIVNFLLKKGYKKENIKTILEEDVEWIVF